MEKSQSADGDFTNKNVGLAWIGSDIFGVSENWGSHSKHKWDIPV
jgi:hypothetical protein